MEEDIIHVIDTVNAIDPILEESLRSELGQPPLCLVLVHPSIVETSESVEFLLDSLTNSLSGTSLLAEKDLLSCWIKLAHPPGGIVVFGSSRGAKLLSTTVQNEFPLDKSLVPDDKGLIELDPNRALDVFSNPSKSECEAKWFAEACDLVFPLDESKATFRLLFLSLSSKARLSKSLSRSMVSLFVLDAKHLNASLKDLKACGVDQSYISLCLLHSTKESMDASKISKSCKEYDLKMIEKVFCLNTGKGADSSPETTELKRFFSSSFAQTLKYRKLISTCLDINSHIFFAHFKHKSEYITKIHCDALKRIKNGHSFMAAKLSQLISDLRFSFNNNLDGVEKEIQNDFNYHLETILRKMLSEDKISDSGAVKAVSKKITEQVSAKLESVKASYDGLSIKTVQALQTELLNVFKDTKRIWGLSEKAGEELVQSNMRLLMDSIVFVELPSAQSMVIPISSSLTKSDILEQLQDIVEKQTGQILKEIARHRRLFYSEIMEVIVSLQSNYAVKSIADAGQDIKNNSIQKALESIENLYKIGEILPNTVSSWKKTETHKSLPKELLPAFQDMISKITFASRQFRSNLSTLEEEIKSIWSLEFDRLSGMGMQNARRALTIRCNPLLWTFSEEDL